VDSPELRQKQFRRIYEHLCEKPRLRPHHIAKDLGLRPGSVGDRLREAIESGYIVGPQIRKKSFSNFRSYMNFIDCDDPLDMYQRCMEDENVIYHAVLDGFCNFQVISKTPMNIEGSILEGVLPDYFLSHPPDHPWGMAINIMRDMVAKFNPEDYTSKNYITNHWNETVGWSQEHEILYQEFKFDLRRLLKPIMRNTGIYMGRIKSFLEQLPEYCTVFTCYYRESLSAYEGCVYTFETDYEDFMIDVFSELPCTCWFYKVGGKLVVHVRMMIKPTKWEDIPIRDVSELQIPFLVKDLVKKEIVKSENHATFKYYWRKKFGDI
jgi:hypothetical protein